MDGLDFVPKRGQHSTPQNKHDLYLRSLPTTSQAAKSAALFRHGNYEGDLSMLGGQSNGVDCKLVRRMELIETDSDTEYKRDIPDCNTEPHFTDSQLLRVYMQCKDNVLSPEQHAHLTAFGTRLCSNVHYRKACSVLIYSGALIVWIIRFTLFNLLGFEKWNHNLLRCRTVLRNAARRVLWWMILAKCNDLSFFAMVLLGAPSLLVLMSLGLMVSLYCELKNGLTRLIDLRKTAAS